MYEYTGKPIRILVTDKHSLVRAGICAALTAKEDLTVVGEATNNYEAQQMSHELEPDLLLFSLNSIDSSLNETMAYLKNHCSEVKVLALAVVENFYRHDLLTAGVMGCLLKDEDIETLVQAIHTVVEGRMWFSQTILKKLVQRKTNNLILNNQSTLTRREQHLLSLIAKGWNNKRIATELCLAQQTVRNYISCLYDKLSVSSRAEAVVWAKEHNF
jgi:DNA-binding NarL/FixJ family response regulator